MSKRPGKTLRQTLSNRVVHWITAISIFSLILSGFGQMPMYKRYNITKLPFSTWLGDYSITLVMHYVGAIILIFIIAYHITIHGLQKQLDAMPKKGDIKKSYLIIKAMVTKGKEPPGEKYLAEQRLAYFAFGLTILLLIITGMIKMAKNISTFHLLELMVTLATQIHNAATFMIIFLIIGHMAAFLIKENRNLLSGMFSGYVEEDYVKHRHALWYEKLQSTPSLRKKRDPLPANEIIKKRKKHRAPGAKEIVPAIFKSYSASFATKSKNLFRLLTTFLEKPLIGQKGEKQK